jgi:hypothetical protein
MKHKLLVGLIIGLVFNTVCSATSLRNITLLIGGLEYPVNDEIKEALDEASIRSLKKL